MNNGTTNDLPVLEMVLDRVLLELEPPPETVGKEKKFFIPQAYRKDRILTRTGTVLARGPGRLADLTGVAIPMFVEVGDRVKIGVHAGYDVSEDGDRDLRLITQQEIVGIISRVSRKLSEDELLTLSYKADRGDTAAMEAIRTAALKAGMTQEEINDATNWATLSAMIRKKL